jgi:hypothetical protein
VAVVLAPGTQRRQQVCDVSGFAAFALRQTEHSSVPENADCEGRSAAYRDAAGGHMAEDDPELNLGGAVE